MAAQPRLPEPSSSQPEHRPSNQGSRGSLAQDRAAAGIPAKGEEAGERNRLPGHNPGRCLRRCPGSDPAADIEVPEVAVVCCWVLVLRLLWGCILGLLRGLRSVVGGRRRLACRSSIRSSTLRSLLDRSCLAVVSDRREVSIFSGIDCLVIVVATGQCRQKRQRDDWQKSLFPH